MSTSSSGSTSRSESGFEEAKFMKDLINLRDTQEAVQGFSAWCIKNRKAAYKIARCWLKIVKRVKVEQKLTLFYLLNDIVQHCRRKNYSEFLMKFEPVLKEAMPHLKDEKISVKVIRCIHIWSDRNVFSEEFLSEIKSFLEEDSEDKESEDIDNFQPTQLCTQIKIMKALEDDTDYKLKTLKDSDINLMDIESLRQTLKDRQDGNDFISDFEKSTTKMQDYIKAIDKELGKRRKVIELLTNGSKYYESLLGEANIVANAYSTFEKRLVNLKKKLNDKIPELEKNPPPPVADSLSPIPSPDYDAPSPINDEYELKLPGEESYNNDPPVAASTNNGEVVNDKAVSPPRGSLDLNQRLNSMMSSEPSSVAPSVDALPSSSNATEKTFSISEFLTRLAEGKPVTDTFNNQSNGGSSSSSNNYVPALNETQPINTMLSAHTDPSSSLSDWWSTPPPPPPPPPQQQERLQADKWPDPWDEPVPEWKLQAEDELPSGKISSPPHSSHLPNHHHPGEKNNLISLVAGSRGEADMDVVDSDHEPEQGEQHNLSLQDRLRNLAGIPPQNNEPSFNHNYQAWGEKRHSHLPSSHHHQRTSPYRGRGGNRGYGGNFDRGAVGGRRGYRGGRW